MSKWAILVVGCVIWPSAACAGQASSQFQVGITITGKRASAPPSTNAATEPVQTTNAAEAKSSAQGRNSLMRTKRQPAKLGTPAPRITSP